MPLSAKYNKWQNKVWNFTKVKRNRKKWKKLYLSVTSTLKIFLQENFINSEKYG